MVLPTSTTSSLLYPLELQIGYTPYEWVAPAPAPARIHIQMYVPKVQPAVGWLPAVSSRIKKSVSSEGIADTEWLNEGAANAAVTFFEDTADILPSEPYIYATQLGDLVAEFQAQDVSFTAVISRREAILFGAVRDTKTEQRIVQTDAKLREETKDFMSSLGVQQNGEMEAP